MNWKYYRQFFENNQIDESYFILGLDIGVNSSSLSYFNLKSESAETLDISGGYGRANPQTALMYVKNSKEWLFGENAIFNINTDDIIISNIFENLSPLFYVDNGEEFVSITKIIAIFIENFINYCSYIHPSAKIAGIVCSIPPNSSSDASQAISEAFRILKLDNILIDTPSSILCILQAYVQKIPVKSDEKALIIDFGATSTRISAYEFDIVDDFEIAAYCLAEEESLELACQSIDNDIKRLFVQKYLELKCINEEDLDSEQKSQLELFFHTNKDFLLQKQQNKEYKLYYSFDSQASYAVVSSNELEKLIQPYKLYFDKLFTRISNKAGGDIDESTHIIATGGGFEMLWAKEFLKDIAKKHFPHIPIYIEKSPKSLISKGAALLAAKNLGIINIPNIKILSQNRIPFDIGIMNSERNFLEILPKNSYLWNYSTKEFLVDTNSFETLDFFVKNSRNEIRFIYTAKLPEISKTQKIAKLSVSILPADIYQYSVEIKDIGFGNISKKTLYDHMFILQIDEKIGVFSQ